MILKIINLSFSYKSKKILDKTTTYFRDNKIYGLIGKNGIGKTTLFKLINNNHKYEGFILLNNRVINNEEIFMIDSSPSLPDFLTGKEYLLYLSKLKGISIDLDELCRKVNLDINDLDKLMIDYSHGMKNKIEFISIMILNPKIILLDEPLTNLDIISQEEIKNILNELKKKHIIIISTHLIDLAFDLCDDIYIMNNYKIKRIAKDKKIIIDKINESYN